MVTTGTMDVLQAAYRNAVSFSSTQCVLLHSTSLLLGNCTSTKWQVPRRLAEATSSLQQSDYCLHQLVTKPELKRLLMFQVFLIMWDGSEGGLSHIVTALHALRMTVP